MSEFIAEAQVLITPNVATFAATLKKQVEAAVLAAGPVAIPVVAAPVAGAAASTAALVAAQQEAAAATLGLASEEAILNSELARQVPLLDAAVLAEQELAASQQLAGAAATQQSAAVAAVTRAQTAGAAAAAKFAKTQEAVLGSSSAVAEAQTVLSRSIAAVAASEKAMAAALAAGNIALIDAAANAHALAVAQEEVAITALAAARGERISAASAAESAAAHSQAARGIAAETLALTGLRGATLAASAPFLVGATAAIIFAKSVKEASDTTEELNKVAIIFGDSAEQIDEFAKTTARSIGISEEAALQATGIFGNLFRSIQIGEQPAADMSQRLVELAADLASFNNASPERTLEALRSGLVGQARPLRVFGVFLTQARAQQQALIDTGKDSVKQLTNAEIVQARYNIILKDSNIAAGDAIRTQQNLAQQSRILSAQLSDVAATIGAELIPIVLNSVQDINLLIGAFKDLSALKVQVPGTEKGGSLDILKDRMDSIFGKRFGRDLRLNFLVPGLGGTVNTVQLLNKAIHLLGTETDETTKKMSGFHFAAGGLTAELKAMAAVANAVNFEDITQQLEGLEVTQLKIQTGLTAGGRAGEEANIRKQIEADKKAVAASKSGTAERKKLLQELKSDQDALASLQAQDASDAKDRADRIKSAADAQQQAAKEAAQAQADATQAFIDTFSGRAARLANRLTSAAQFGTAKTQIALNKLVIAADKAEIEAIQDRIKHLKLHGDALKLAQKTIQTLTQEIFNTRNAILQLQQERQQALISARQTHLEAQLSIAQTTESTKDDTAAEKALKKFDQQQIRRILAIKRRRRLTLDEAAQLDAFRVDLAQRNEALRKSTEEQKKGKTFAEQAFKFLQTQQGFAANLLGNLIPGFATKGLVGGSTPTPGQPMLAGPDDRARATANVGATRAAGVRPVQVDTTNALLRQILAALNGRHTQPPEIRHNRATGNAVADTL